MARPDRRKILTDAQATAALRKMAPHWREYLADPALCAEIVRKAMAVDAPSWTNRKRGRLGA